MSRIKKTLTITAIAGAAALSANAQTANSEYTLIKRITESQIESIITNTPNHTLLPDTIEGKVYARGETNTGLKYSMQGMACNEAGCLGLMIQVRYTASWPQNYEYLNRANYRRAAATTMREDEDTLIVQRYLILDGGMTAKNVEYSIRNLVAIAPTALEIARTGEIPE